MVPEVCWTASVAECDANRSIRPGGVYLDSDPQEVQALVCCCVTDWARFSLVCRPRNFKFGTIFTFLAPAKHTRSSVLGSKGGFFSPVGVSVIQLQVLMASTTQGRLWIRFLGMIVLNTYLQSINSICTYITHLRQSLQPIKADLLLFSKCVHLIWTQKFINLRQAFPWWKLWITSSWLTSKCLSSSSDS